MFHLNYFSTRGEDNEIIIIIIIIIIIVIIIINLKLF